MTAPIEENLAAVRNRVARACERSGRDPAAVTLVAVGKAQPPSVLARAVAAGVSHLAESYWQEAEPKIAALPRKHVTWHFIGPVQSNKTAGIARDFDWVQSVDREKIAQRLSGQRPAGAPPLQVCVQVNVSGEATKSGVFPADAADLCRAVAALPRLRLRGLMAIPARGADPRHFVQLRELFESLRRAGFELDTLSAGMSNDFERAIEEGSTMVRVGTAIFGQRGSGVEG